MKKAVTPEFSRIVPVEDLAEGEKHRLIEADAEERRALAQRFGLDSIGSITADFRFLPASGGTLVVVEGCLVADVVQRCVVSLEPVPAHIDKKFAETFGPPDYTIPDGEENAEIPEKFDKDGIDLGELAAQILLLSLDPYPRAPNRAAAGAMVASEEVAGRSRPLAALGEMMGKRRN